MAEKDICKVMLKDVRLSFPQLFRAKAFGDGTEGQPAFSAEFLIDKTTKLGEKTIDLIEDAREEAKYKEWGDDPKKWPKISKDKPFFKDGDDDDFARPETVDCMIVSARNGKKPRVLGIDKEDLHESDNIIYGGCFVDAIVRIWAQDNKYGKRINCSLEAVRFRRDGEPFGAAPINVDEFEDIDEGDDDRRSSRSSTSRGRGRDKEEDEKPRGRRNRDEEVDDEKPRSRRSSRDEEVDDEKPRSRGRRDEEVDDEKPRSRRGRDDEKDERDDDRGSRRSSRDREEVEEDEKPRGRGRDRDDEPRGRDRDDDDRGSRRSSRDEDDNDRPSRNSRSSRRGASDDI